MSFYEVGYKNKHDYDVEFKVYNSLEEATKAFKYLEEKAKQFEDSEIYPYIHKHEMKSVFNQSDYEIEKLYSN